MPVTEEQFEALQHEFKLLSSKFVTQAAKLEALRKSQLNVNKLMKQHGRVMAVHNKDMVEFTKYKPLYQKLDSAGALVTWIEEDLRHLHGRVQVLHHKECVFTECQYFVNQHPGSTANVMSRLLECSDYPDKFWNKNRNAKIEQWIHAAACGHLTPHWRADWRES